MLKKTKICKWCEEGGPCVSYIDYTDVNRLTRFTTDQGKIIPRRTSGNCARSQRLLKRAIKRARFLALMPYVMENFR